MSMPTSHSYYGPQPKDLVSRWQLVRFAAATWVSAGVVRHLARVRQFTCIGEEDIEIVRACSSSLCFAMRIPNKAPAGFAIASCAPSTVMGDAVTIRLKREDDGAEFELAQRPAWLPVGELLSTARVPHTRALGCGTGIFVVHGQHGGEPIDWSFWTTRQIVMFQDRGLTFELRVVRGQGPGLPVLLNYAVQIQRGGV